MKAEGPMLFVLRASPNESAGTPIIMRRLLENFSSNEVVVLSRSAKKSRAIEKKFTYPVIETFAPHVKGRKVFALMSGVFTGLWVIVKYRPKSLIGVYPDDGALLLAFILHRITGIPMISYFCDLYLENKKGIELKLARWLQPQVFKRSQRVISVNRGMQEFYLQRYGLDTAMVPTAINHVFPISIELPPMKKKFIIGYSGSISRDRVQPFRKLVELIRKRSDLELRFFAPHSQTHLESLNLWIEGSSIQFCKNEVELLAALQECHLLYLPLTFELADDSKEQLSTCFGIKSYEYILACRPILIHCPSDYFTYRFFSESNAAVLVGDDSDELLESTVIKTKDHYDTIALPIVTNALRLAYSFIGSKIRKDFIKATEFKK